MRAQRERERESSKTARKGIPIGNVTSQIFANIYLHELDRFVKHDLRVRGYLRYGDDFVLFGHDRKTIEEWRIAVIAFLSDHLRLSLHSRNDVLLPCRRGLRFLGYEIFPSGRRLRKRMKRRMECRLDLRNLSSYRGMMLAQENSKCMRLFNWQTLDIIETKFPER